MPDLHGHQHRSFQNRPSIRPSDEGASPMKTAERNHDAVTDRPPSERRGHVGRLTAVTMGAGAVSALVLAAVVFGGATEPVITGVVLLAFAASWSMYAVLSTRRTDQPQRWARVPAAVMAVAGAMSLLLRPSAQAMSAVGWVWPIGLVALAIWMVVQSRRSLRSWSRRAVLYPIFALMIIGGFGAAYETVREAQDRSTYAMPGQLVDVGGHRLHISCTGTGSPTVVLEGGLGEPSTMMAGWIAPAVAGTTRVCVYDRAGRGWSDPAPEGQDGLAVVADLHTLLERHGEVGPFVLAGHSSGGVYVQAYAATYPDEVAGMVLLDSQPGEALTRLPDYPAFYAGFRKATGVMPSAARFGLMRLISSTVAGSLPEPQRAEERAFLSTASHNRSLRDEFLALPAAMARARQLTTLGAKPLVVVTAEKDAQAGWMPLQDELAGLSTNSDHRVLPDVDARLAHRGRSRGRDLQPGHHRCRAVGPVPQPDPDQLTEPMPIETSCDESTQGGAMRRHPTDWKAGGGRQHNPRRWRSSAALVVLALLVAGCGRSTAAEPTPQAVPMSHPRRSSVRRGWSTSSSPWETPGCTSAVSGPGTSPWS